MKVLLWLAAVLLASGLLACGANQSVLNSGRETPAANVESVKSSFAQDLDEFRTADFSFIFVLRRRDGGEMDAEDRSVIKMNTSDANRRVSADGGKAFIIGANNKLAPNNMAALYGRFAVEDHSPLPSPTPVPTLADPANK